MNFLRRKPVSNTKDKNVDKSTSETTLYKNCFHNLRLFLKIRQKKFLSEVIEVPYTLVYDNDVFK